jgi:hypothetical protein
VENFVDYGPDVAKFEQIRKQGHQSTVKGLSISLLFSYSFESELGFSGLFGGQPARIPQKMKFPQFAVSAP